MSIRALVNYHIKCKEPQAFKFDVDGIIGNLVSPVLESRNVQVNDVRDRHCTVNFEQDGIAFVSAPSSVSKYGSEESWTKTYNNEITALLENQIGAKEVLVFDHTVRIDELDAARKPARNVHNDYSAKGADQRLIDLIGKDQAQVYQQGHFGFVNIWRPVEFQITTSPLGFIRPSSMKSDDWMDIELIYPDRLGKILGVAANDNHEWFYQSKMTPEEVIIFNIYDNRGRPYLAHSALDVVGQAPTNVPRKSIETRTLVRY